MKTWEPLPDPPPPLQKPDYGFPPDTNEPMVGITDAVTGYTTMVRGIGPNVTVNNNIFDFALTPAQITGLAAVTLGYGNVTCPGFTITSGNPYPEEFLGTNTPPWTDTKSVTGDPTTQWYAYIIVTVDMGSPPPNTVTSISWDTFTTAQTDDSSSGTFYFLLGGGYVSEDGTTAIVSNSTGRGSQTFGICPNWYSNPLTYTANWTQAGPAGVPAS